MIRLYDARATCWRLNDDALAVQPSDSAIVDFRLPGAATTSSRSTPTTKTDKTLLDPVRRATIRGLLPRLARGLRAVHVPVRGLQRYAPAPMRCSRWAAPS